MEQRFGQPAAQARPSPFQLIQEANANEMKVEKSNKPPKKEIQKEIVLPEDVTVKQLAQKLGGCRKLNFLQRSWKPTGVSWIGVLIWA